jgi:long-chain fatty acid transport protein
MKVFRAAALAALLWPGVALATAGYFQLGYGIKAKGMGGVGIALPQDALAGAINPAGMAWVGNRVDAGVEWFSADRGSEITPGNTLGLSGRRDANGRKSFLVPDFGFNRMLDADRSIGLTVVGNGGMTRYADNPLANLGGSSPGGMEFAQVIAAPAFAMRLAERHALGVAVNLVYQEFAARGLEHFDDPVFTQSVGRVTNRGRDSSTGVGIRLGWLGRLTDSLTAGATWQPRIRMRKFDLYKGLLANQGSFDVPEQYGAGIALRATSSLTFAADIERINFAGVGKSTECFLLRTCFLGAPDGPGSGWRNTTVYKLGAAWELGPEVTLRAGVATLRQPISSAETLINLFAPAVSENHLTLGATWKLSPAWELSASFMHAFSNSVSGTHSMPAGAPPGGVGGAEANLRMKQNGLGLALGWKL